jgi:hypothetical protein
VWIVCWVYTNDLLPWFRQNSTVDPQKLCNFVFSSSLFEFYRSLITFVFPEKWKLSFVTPIYKSGKINDVANYHGIAILSAVSKLFAHLICKTMYEDLRGLIYEGQYGYLQGRSKVTKLIEYTVASESIRTTSFFGITFLCVDIFPPIFQGFCTIWIPTFTNCYRGFTVIYT